MLSIPANKGAKAFFASSSLGSPALNLSKLLLYDVEGIEFLNLVSEAIILSIFGMMKVELAISVAGFGPRRKVVFENEKITSMISI